MKLINYKLSGLIEFLAELYKIDDYYASKGNSNRENNNQEGRVQLGANSSSVLSNIQMTFEFADMTLFDIETMKKISTDVYVVNTHYSYNPTQFNITELAKALPDISNYIQESSNVLSDIAKDNITDGQLLYPIGCFKFDVIVSFRGKDILMLFNGFIENYIYSNFKRSNDLLDTETVENIVKRDTLKVLMTTFMKVSYQSSQKPSLIEDYLIERDYFSFISKNNKIKVNRNNKYTVSIASVLYSSGLIKFYGTNSETLNDELTRFRQKRIFDMGMFSNNVMITFGITSNMLIFFILKLFGTGFNIIANQKYDIPFSDTNYSFLVNSNTQKKFEIRINSLINHNNECRKIVIKDVNTSTNLSHPSNRYGMIFTGQHIKYLIQVTASDIDNIKINNIGVSDELLLDAKSTIDEIKKIGNLVKTKYLLLSDKWKEE